MANVLIVDDDRAALKQMEVYVRSLGHVPISTVLPNSVIAILDNEAIDLVLLDIYMPGIGGLTVLENIKRHEEHKTLPVIILTSDTDEGLLERCFKAGASDFINKPLREVVFRSRIQSVLKTEEYASQLRTVSAHMREFVGIVSHDLRGPIGSFATICDILLNDPSVLPEFIGDMADVSKRMIGLVNDLLDLTAIERGDITMNVVDCNLSVIADSAIKEVKFLADSKGVRVVNNAESVQDVKADVFRISQVLNNLLANAIKFTPKGGEIEVKVVPADGGAILKVIDTGVGIEPERIPKLFVKHEAASTRGTAGEVGTGYGLPLAQEVMRAHASKIEVHSREGEGSTFEFFLPFA